MKVQKTISLTPTTAAIADKMDNFSQWIRISLRAYADNLDIGTVMRDKIKWAQTAKYLAAFIEQHPEICDGQNAQQLEYLGMEHARKQMTLEDFE